MDFEKEARHIAPLDPELQDEILAVLRRAYASAMEEAPGVLEMRIQSALGSVGVNPHQDVSGRGDPIQLIEFLMHQIRDALRRRAKEVADGK